MRAWLANPAHKREALIGIAAAAVLLVLLLRRRGAAAADTSTTGDVGPLVDPSTLTSGLPYGFGGGDPGVGVTPAPNDGGGDIIVPPLPGETPDDVGEVPDPQTGKPPADTPPAGAPKQAGFWWNVGGKQTWVTKAKKASFLAELRKHGVNVDVWAAQHPDAARAIGITPPTHPPPERHQAHEGTTGVARRHPTSGVAKTAVAKPLPKVKPATLPKRTAQPIRHKRRTAA